MKTHSILILICILHATVYSQVQSSCQKSPELAYYYKFDVADLAMQRMYEINSPDTNLIEIPQLHLDSVWNGLAAIYNTTEIPERDSAFDIFCIHNVSTFSTFLWQSIFVVLDTSVSWTGNWINGEIETGNIELDNFISDYNYQIYYSNPAYAYLVIISDSLINSYAICDSLMTFPGIESAEPNSTTGDANKIQYHVEDEYQYFTFMLAWGDCFAGCIFHHSWNFKVHYSDCTVEYLGLESNNPNNLPNPTNCNITAIDDNTYFPNDIVIFPNPADERISIKGKEIQSIKVFDEFGVMLQSFDRTYDMTTLNIENLKPGIYFLRIESKGAFVNRKLIKN